MKKSKILSLTIASLLAISILNNTSYAMQIQPTPSNTEVISSLTQQLKERMLRRANQNNIKNILVDKILMTSTSYDTRNNVSVNVYDQGQTNTCWANASNSALEVYLAKVNEEQLRLSRRHMVYSILSPLSAYEYGAYFEDAGAYYTSGRGPVLETTMPWQANSNPITSSEQEILNNTSSIKQIAGWEKIPPIYKYIENGTVKYTYYDYTSYTSGGQEYQWDYIRDTSSIQYADDTYVTKARENIKTCIMEYGAVFATMDCNATNDTGTNEGALEASTTAFNRKSNVSSEYGYHAVCIIGWDDNYATTNFPEATRPSTPGAYLILNSWGEDSHTNGCFWISYEDVFIEKNLSVYTGVKNVEYNNIYQYDTTGVASAIYTNKATSAYGANVFTRENTEEPEKITEIGITNVYEASYEIYVNSTDGEISSTKMQKVATVENCMPGYNTIKLGTPIELTGQKFAIAVKYNYSSDMGYAIIGIEEPSRYGINTGYMFNAYNENATSSSGQSYVGTSLDSMKDITSSNTGFSGWTTYENLSKANVPIKAFTQIEEEKDTTAPTITQLSIQSNNANSKYATTGDTINITIKTDEELKTLPTVKICNISCTVEKETTNQYKANLQVTNQITEGEVSISVSGYADEAGNQGVALYQTTDSTKVIIDRTAPTIKLSDVQITNKTSLEAEKEDEIILLTLDITDANIKEINLQETNITVKIEEKTVQLETKTITSQKEIENGKQYTLKIQGIPETGKLTLEIESGIAKDYANLTNEKTTISTGVNITEKTKTEEITSTVYNITENTIKNIKEQTQVQKFLGNIQNSSNVKIYDENNKEATNQTIVKTGMKLINNTKEYTLVVVGDTSGDGKITATDLSQIKLHIVETKKLQNEYEQAGDINADNKITSTDLSKVKSHIVGIELIK